MRRILHVITNENDPLPKELIASQTEANGDWEIRTFDLTAGEPDYRELLNAIFASDSVQVW